MRHCRRFSRASSFARHFPLPRWEGTVMANRTRTGIALLMLAQALSGCGSNPLKPTLPPTPITITTAPAGPVRLQGSVVDTGLRPVAGATVEVLQGPEAGM